MMHIDLFSGIGGFSYAIDQVFNTVDHIFCEIDPFCRQVLRKHWPESEIYGDIRTITKELFFTYQNKKPSGDSINSNNVKTGTIVLTGGFPCQPFSSIGKRKGTADNRYLWPEMFRIIQFSKPSWVIAENVYGFVAWSGGMVLEQVCADLESEGYEVQPFIIPSCAVNAPHRRNRVWIIGHAKRERLEGHSKTNKGSEGWENKIGSITKADWERNWVEVATEICGVDDGLPARMDGFELSKSRHRKERLKSLGNAIVPQVAIEILKCIKQVEEWR